MNITLPSITSISGSTGSGKSYLTRQLLNNQLKGQFHYLFIFSPTTKLSLDWQSNGFKESKENHKASFLNPKIIYVEEDFEKVAKDIFDKQSMLKVEYNKKKDDKEEEDTIKKIVPQVLLIFDDLGNTPLFRFNGFLDKVCISSRHFNVSMIIITQRISAIPRTLRLNSSYFIIFNSFNYSEIERFAGEYVQKKYKKKLYNLLETIFSEDYNFIFANNKSNKVNERLYKNGVELINFE